MKRFVCRFVLLVVLQLLLIPSISFASLPVKYTSEACVSGGKVYTLSQGKKQYPLELPKGYNLGPYEGKKVLLEGELTPGDYFVPKDKSMKVLGPCAPSAGMPATAAPPPAKPTPPPPQPTAPPSKPAAATPPPPSAPQPAKPVTQQPPKPTPQPPQAPAPKPSQPTAQKPQTGGQSPSDCRKNCQRQYDEKIRNCAGYQLGNTAKACKDPLVKELEACMGSCR